MGNRKRNDSPPAISKGASLKGDRLQEELPRDEEKGEDHRRHTNRPEARDAQCTSFGTLRMAW